MVVENSINKNLKLCECGHCNELIPKRDKKNRPKKYKKGHGNKTDKNPNWKGGKKLCGGYIVIRQNKTYQWLHRVIYEEYHKCCLLKKSVVHHIDGNKQNNSIENLVAYPSNSLHIKNNHRSDFSDRICYFCKSSKTYINKKTGYARWLRHKKKKNVFICSNCYKRFQRGLIIMK